MQRLAFDAVTVRLRELVGAGLPIGDTNAVVKPDIPSRTIWCEFNTTIANQA
jgi:hypothetical protein